MAYPHLGKMNAVLRTLNAVVILSAAETVPHRFDVCTDSSRSPIRITVICHHAAEVLKLLIFILNRAFQPVFAVKIHDNAALVKAVVCAGKVRFHHKREEFFFRFHLENRGVVVPKMVIGPLPQIGSRFGGNLNTSIRDGMVLRLPRPHKFVNVSIPYNWPPNYIPCHSPMQGEHPIFSRSGTSTRRPDPAGTDLAWHPRPWRSRR